MFGLSLFITGKVLTTCSSQMGLYVEYLLNRFCREPWQCRGPRAAARGSPVGDSPVGRGDPGSGVLINLTEFRILTEEAYTVCNLPFQSISAVWPFLPAAPLCGGSHRGRAGARSCLCSLPDPPPPASAHSARVCALPPSSASNSLMGYSSGFQAV